MATPLDSISGVLGAILPFFIALFVWVVMYALLEKTGVVSNNKNRNSIIALVTAVLVIALPDLTRIITLVVPWFFFLFMFLFLVGTGFLFVSGGTSFDGFIEALGGNSATWIFIVIGGLILAFAAASVYGQSLLPLTSDAGNTTASNGGSAANGNLGTATDTGSFRTNLGATLFNPSILGLAIFFLIATFAIIFLTQEGGGA